MHREIHIWRIQAQDDVEPPEEALRQEERHKMQRFRNPLHGRRWACFRIGMRHILSRYLHTASADINIVVGEHGKPAIRDRPDVYFNLSHSGAVGLLSVTALAQVGIDIEYKRDLPAMVDVIDQCFTSQERAALTALPEEQRKTAFYQLWTCKEAVMKASGLGLHMPPDRFHIGCPTPNDWQSVRVPGAVSPTRHFRLTRFEASSEYEAAVALEVTGAEPLQEPRLRFFEFAPGDASWPDAPMGLWPNRSLSSREKTLVGSA